jgi:TRAP-type C4-dicarboxylate transport system substrate-binding protein
MEQSSNHLKTYHISSQHDMKRRENMRNKKSMLIAVMAMSLIAGLALGVNGVQAKPIKISFMHYFPATHFVHTEIVEPWTKLMEKESGDKLKFNLYPAAALAKPPDFFDAVVAGSIDIVIGYSGYTPGRFPVGDVFGLPFMGYNSTRSATRTFMELWRDVPEIAKEWRAVKVLWFGSPPPAQLHTTKTPVRTLSDMKGLKIKIAGKPAPFLKVLGATPITMSSPEVYDALSKGVINGVSYPWEAIKGWNLGDLVFNHTWLNLYAEPFFVVMNWNKWKSLSPEMQKLFQKYGGEYGAELWVKAWAKGNKGALEWLEKDPKHTVITLSRAEQEKAKDLEQPHYDKWLKNMEKKGIDGKALLEKARKTAQMYAD